MVMLSGDGKNLHKFVLSIIFGLIIRYSIGLLLIDFWKSNFNKKSIPFSQLVNFEKA